MIGRLASYALALVVCAGAEAATINTTLTVNATLALSGTGFALSGTTNFTGGIGTGKIAATIAATALTSDPVKANVTITLDSGGTMTGTVSVPLALVTGSSTSGSVGLAVTGGTGTYAGASGTFSLNGSISGSLVSGFTLSNFTGTGTITTTGGGGPTGPPTPTITAVQDAGAYTNNIAQGSIFVVKGSNLSASGFSQMSFPLPTTSGNVKITFTPAAGGTGTDAYLVYLYNQSGVNQLAGVLPSTVTPGNYNVTVTYNGTASTGFLTQVVARKPGLITADSSGTGLAVIQNYISASQLDIDRLTTYASGGFTFSPSKPGQVLIAWATGMGSVTGGDNTASPGFDFTKNGVNIQVIVGGTMITPLYAGRAPGLAGADQINFQLPSNITTGCAVPFQVSVNGTLSNPSYIAIAPDANSGNCVLPGFTSDQLKNFDNGGSYTVGGFSMIQLAESVPSIGSVKLDTAAGAFTKYTGFQLAGLAENQYTLSNSGACTLIHTTTTGTGAASGTMGTSLDAGTVTLSGPSGSNLNNTPFTQSASNLYSLPIGAEGFSIPGYGNGSLVAGTYTLAGAGGKDVGSFQSQITLGTPLTITGGLPTTINRSAGLTLNWTGGNATDVVSITGSTSTSTGSGANMVFDSWTFYCNTTAGAKTITVPASLLTQMPAAALSANGSGGGSLGVSSGPTPSTFTASLKAGGSIDVGFFLSLVGYGAQVTYQ
jgi:uncharacterized protein (TIGR03437 family)